MSSWIDHLADRLEPLFEAYRKAWGLRCVLSDSQGRIVRGGHACMAGCALEMACAEARARAIDESARWGEPSILLCPQDNLIWAVPVMENNRILGGLIASARPGRQSGADTRTPKEIRQAAAGLLGLAEQDNLTNSAYLAARRAESRRESDRARAIHELKGHSYQTIREVFLVEEPALISAIRQGNRDEARGIINRVLVSIYYLGRNRPSLLKSLLLELVVMMSRSAVEAGADPSEVLGANYSSLADLSEIDGEEQLTGWLVAMLERIMDAITAHHHYPISALLSRAVAYMQEHLSEDLSRDVVAGVACLSPSHFSRVMKQTFGQSFTELLTQMRVDQAREMLIRTEKSLMQICLDCGFNDQSYFTKVFQKHAGRPPGEYRRLQRTI